MLKIKKLVIGFILSVLGTAVVLSLLSWITLKTGLLSEKLSGTLTIVGVGAVLLVSALLTARSAGEGGLLHGAMLSAVFSTVYTALAYILCRSVSVALVLTNIAAFLLCGAIGGIIGVSAKRKIQF